MLRLGKGTRGNVDGDSALISHGVAGVHRKVHKDLLKLAFINADVAEVAGVIYLYLKASADELAHHIHNVGKGFRGIYNLRR